MTGAAYIIAKKITLCVWVISHLSEIDRHFISKVSNSYHFTICLTFYSATLRLANCCMYLLGWLQLVFWVLEPQIGDLPSKLCYSSLGMRFGIDETLESVCFNLTECIFVDGSERPIQENLISADTDNRPTLPILSADISAENYVKLWGVCNQIWYSQFCKV